MEEQYTQLQVKHIQLQDDYISLAKQHHKALAEIIDLYGQINELTERVNALICKENE